MADRKGKTYLVSGGASGLGEATVRRLASEGANVVILDINEDAGNRIAAELGDKVIFLRMDAFKEESIIKAVADSVAKFGGIHGSIACAGGGFGVSTVVHKKGAYKSKIWDMTIGLNLTGVFNLQKHAALAMSKNEADEHGLRGVLINCASVAAVDGQKGQVAYSAAKAGLVGMTLPMARDLARYGIRVMTIMPGTMGTDLMLAAPPAVAQPLQDAICAPKRFGLPDEFALMCTQIVDNPYLNGESIRLDGAIRMPYVAKSKM
mmetsp:Transcript_3275/g.3895  ORF Transcript_3275/g.3895 Transcript_3275/m.3895 type:complete len:263 (-) Transcript_3275:122-910(-)